MVGYGSPVISPFPVPQTCIYRNLLQLQHYYLQPHQRRQTGGFSTHGRIYNTPSTLNINKIYILCQFYAIKYGFFIV